MEWIVVPLFLVFVAWVARWLWRAPRRRVAGTTVSSATRPTTPPPAGTYADAAAQWGADEAALKVNPYLAGYDKRFRQRLKGRIRGRAWGVSIASEGSGSDAKMVMRFTLERFGRLGDRLVPVPVEMRGSRFAGTVREGDEVEVRRHWRGKRALKVSRLFNLTTGVFVNAKKAPLMIRLATFLGWLFYWTIMVAIVGGAVFVLIQLLQQL